MLPDDVQPKKRPRLRTELQRKDGIVCPWQTRPKKTQSLLIEVQSTTSKWGLLLLLLPPCRPHRVELINAGAQPLVGDVGEGNEACAACIREYKDALASVVIRRWSGGAGGMDWLRLVADYIYCK